ncbi:MAG TPA: helix-turn-helix domain-containing protein [Ktedonobacteraceae bacterium]|jgi:transcriptional regulator with XRE-family HTH domain|nr:helix-turn-helix domain-containing protein [Ktedonobacteraceae bacterium]
MKYADKSVVGSRIRDERERRGLSQSELAEEVGVDTANVSRWERGQTIPRPRYRKALSIALGKSLDDLFGEEASIAGEEPTEPPEKRSESEPLEDTSQPVVSLIHNPPSSTEAKLPVFSSKKGMKTTNYHPIAVIALVLAVIIVATSFILKASPENLQSLLPLYAPYGGTLMFEDPLHQNVDLRWEVGQNHSTNSPGNCAFNGKGYYVSATNYYHQCDDQIDDFGNFALQIHMELGKGSEGGVLFRTHNPAGYYFGIDDSGNYEVLRFGSAQPYIMREITERNSPRQSYVLAIVANGPSIDLYVDGLKLDHFSDKTYTDGHLSLFADGSYQPHIPETEATFTDLKVWRL